MPNLNVDEQAHEILSLIVFSSKEGSGEPVQKPRLARAFAFASHTQ